VLSVDDIGRAVQGQADWRKSVREVHGALNLMHNFDDDSTGDYLFNVPPTPVIPAPPTPTYQPTSPISPYNANTTTTTATSPPMSPYNPSYQYATRVSSTPIWNAMNTTGGGGGVATEAAGIIPATPLSPFARDMQLHQAEGEKETQSPDEMLRAYAVRKAASGNGGHQTMRVLYQQ